MTLQPLLNVLVQIANKGGGGIYGRLLVVAKTCCCDLASHAIENGVPAVDRDPLVVLLLLVLAVACSPSAHVAGCYASER
jgi:hypothetical protein